MPHSKSKKPFVSRKRRTRHRRKKAVISRNLLKKKTLVQMKYAQEVNITPSSSSMTSHVFRANSIFDPDLTTTGHQPLTHDQYALLYSTYRVTGASCKVTPLYDLATNSVPMVWGLYIDTDPTLTYVKYDQLVEDSNRTTSQIAIWGGVQNADAGRVGPSMIKTFNSARLLSKEGSNNATAFGSNPATGANFDAYFQLFAGAINGNTPNQATFLVEIIYTVELTDPIVLGQS